MAAINRLAPDLARVHKAFAKGAAAAGASLSILLGSFTADAAEPCRDALSGRAALGSKAALGGVDAFYASWGKSCAWSEDSIEALQAALKSAPEHGLDARLFYADDISRRLDSRGRAAELDVVLTAAALKYATAMTAGLGGGNAEEKAALQNKLATELATALRDNRMQRWLDSLPPKEPGYERLKYALSVYRGYAQAGGWERLPKTLKLKRGKKSPQVRLLKARLAAEGLLDPGDKGRFFDDATIDAVRRFQASRGLGATGKITPDTIRELNVGAADRAAQIAANLDRWRSFARVLSPTRVEVNAAAATATLYRDREPVMSMNAVVGKPQNMTPMLHSAISTVIFNPSWVIPRSIVEKEIKPAIAKNPKYLERNHMYWAKDGQLVQEPGDFNALGRVKFEFPNRYSVYLHDTPAHSLFRTVDRAQSHGCVRLQSPVDLAEELLKDAPDWSREAIEQAIQDGTTLRARLTKDVPVTLSYWTAFVADDGTIEFRPDVYKRDGVILGLLAPDSVDRSGT